jgi:DNA-binding beta-propeller fold protein YncE
MSIDNDIREAFERHADDVHTRGDAWAGVQRRIERGHRRRLAVSAFVAGAVVASLAVGIPRLSVPAPPISPAETRPLPEAIPQLVAKIGVAAVAIAPGDDEIWAVSAGPTLGARGTLVRIDPEMNRVTRRIPVGFDPVAVAVGDGSVWVVNGEGCGNAFERDCAPGEIASPRPSDLEFSVWRIDERSLRVEAKIVVGRAGDIAVGEGAAWVTAEGGVKRIDLRRNEVATDIRLPGEGTMRIDIGYDRVWVVTEESPAGHGFLNVIDPQTNEILKTMELTVAGTTPDVAVGAGGAWATTTSETTVSALMRVDSTAQGEPELIQLPDAAPVGLNAVTIGHGYVWATSARGYLWKVDPETNRPSIEPILIGDTPPVGAVDVASGFGSIWVASGDGQIWRLDP